MSDFRPPSLSRVETHLLRQHFPAFLRKAFATVDPQTPFLSNWHLDAMGEYLEATKRGEIRRLLINLPPRMLKSVCVSVAWPAFLLGHNPATRILAASYSSYLAVRHAQDCRLLVTSPWFRRSFPEFAMAPGQNEKHKFVTSRQGFRFATSVGGSATGEGGDVLIVDDPLNPLQAASLSRRSMANQWFDQTFSTRLNDKKAGVIIVVMQRLHPGDLTGHLLEKGGWEQLLLPAIAEARSVISLGSWRHVREAGVLLHPAREDDALLARARRDLGSHGFAAQYQQAPLALDSGLFRSAWLARYESLPPELSRITQSWDTAIKAGAHHDASVCLTFGQADGVHYLIDALVVRDEYPALRRRILAQAEQYQPETILIEDKASGQSLLQDLRKNGLPLLAIQPRGDKLLRAARISPMVEAGLLRLPASASWLPEFEGELLGFPQTAHDDQIDALTQYLTWARDRERSSMTIRSL